MDHLRRPYLLSPTAGATHLRFSFYHMEKSLLSTFIPIDDLDLTICGELTMPILSDLTIRELEILQLVLVGYTNRAITAEIFVSEKTVEFHSKKIETEAREIPSSIGLAASCMIL